MTVVARARRPRGASRFRFLLNVRDQFFAPGEGAPVVLGSLAIVVLGVGFILFASHTNPDTWVPVLVFFSLVLISAPLCIWMARGDRRLRKLLLLGLLLKLLSTGPRYYLNEGYYDGEVDAKRYDQAGDFFVQNLSEGKWSIEGSELDAFPRQTRIVGYITGVLYIGFGTSYYGGYLVFSWVCWLGLVFCFKAFRIAYPNAPPYLAAKLLFFLPSLMFWPSSLGKDAVMVFLIGWIALGVSRLLTGTKAWLGIIWMAGGGILAAQIRPHILLVALAGLGASMLSRSTGHTALRGVAVRLILIALLVPALVFGINQMDAVLGTKAGGSETLDEALNSTVNRTEIGGSAFETAPVRSPLDVPLALITVIYRPFIFEARNIAVLISAMEGTLLIGLTIGASRWIWRIGPAMYRSSFAAYCGAFVLGFVIAFSNIGNAGILSRQRVQMYPMLILVACAAREHYRLNPSGPAVLHPSVGPDGDPMPGQGAAPHTLSEPVTQKT